MLFLDRTSEPMHNMYHKEVFSLPTEKPRLTIALDEKLLSKIDDFRFENRYPSRSAAVIALIKKGLDNKSESLSKD